MKTSSTSPHHSTLHTKRANDMAEAPPEEVVMVAVPFPAQGHLNALLHFSLLVSSYDVTVYYVCSHVHNRQAKDRIQGWDISAVERIRFHDLEFPPFDNSPPSADLNFPTHLVSSWSCTARIQSQLNSLLRSVTSTARRVVVLHDFFVPSAGHEAALFPNCESYAFNCIPAFYQLAGILLNHRDMETQLLGDSEDPKLRDLILRRFDGTFSNEAFEFVSSLNFETPVEAGVVTNSSRAFDDKFVSLLARHESYVGKKIFLVGPVNRLQPNSSRQHECLAWLDKQPPASVVYVAFGSTVTLPEEQIKQLAEGLKLSGQRFIWVLKGADRGDIYAGQETNSSEKKTMVEYDGEIGMVVRGWAPQLEILWHSSTGTFISHCGWNSCMEGLGIGVPIIAWPIHSDQPTNAMFLTEYLQVGALMREWERREEIVSSERIAEVVRTIMVEEKGKKIRARAKTLGEAIRASVEEDGSSNKDLKSFISHITR